jgi:hypothetical protein
MLIRIALLTLLLATCTAAGTNAQETASSGQAAAPMALSGTVLESFDSSRYTYLHLSTAAGPVWAAIPQTTVEEGAPITLQPGMRMIDFYSQGLDRTFAVITFSPGIITDRGTARAEPPPAEETEVDSFAAAVAAENRAAQSNVPVDVPGPVSGGSQAAVAPFIDEQVSKATGPNGYTVEEIFTQAKELDGSTVRVRGRVIKQNVNIMGRNWLHIQDGTGNPMQNTHDLVITSQDTAELSQIVTIEGTLAADRDFGAGYRYQVILENGDIVTQ